MLTYTEFDNLMLDGTDLKYLRKIKRFGKFAVKDPTVRKHLGTAKLVYSEYVGPPGEALRNSGNLLLSENGKMYFIYRKQRAIKFLFRSVLVPILVAVITTLITLGLRGMFQ